VIPATTKPSSSAVVNKKSSSVYDDFDDDDDIDEIDMKEATKKPSTTANNNATSSNAMKANNQKNQKDSFNDDESESELDDSFHGRRGHGNNSTAVNNKNSKNNKKDESSFLSIPDLTSSSVPSNNIKRLSSWNEPPNNRQSSRHRDSKPLLEDDDEDDIDDDSIGGAGAGGSNASVRSENKPPLHAPSALSPSPAYSMSMTGGGGSVMEDLPRKVSNTSNYSNTSGTFSLTESTVSNNYRGRGGGGGGGSATDEKESIREKAPYSYSMKRDSFDMDDETSHRIITKNPSDLQFFQFNRDSIDRYDDDSPRGPSIAPGKATGRDGGGTSKLSKVEENEFDDENDDLSSKSSSAGGSKGGASGGSGRKWKKRVDLDSHIRNENEASRLLKTYTTDTFDLSPSDAGDQSSPPALSSASPSPPKKPTRNRVSHNAPSNTFSLTSLGNDGESESGTPSSSPEKMKKKTISLKYSSSFPMSKEIEEEEDEDELDREEREKKDHDERSGDGRGTTMVRSGISSFPSSVLSTDSTATAGLSLDGELPGDTGVRRDRFGSGLMESVELDSPSQRSAFLRDGSGRTIDGTDNDGSVRGEQEGNKKKRNPMKSAAKGFVLLFKGKRPSKGGSEPPPMSTSVDVEEGEGEQEDPSPRILPTTTVSMDSVDTASPSATVTEMLVPGADRPSLSSEITNDTTTQKEATARSRSNSAVGGLFSKVTNAFKFTSSSPSSRNPSPARSSADPVLQPPSTSSASSSPSVSSDLKKKSLFPSFGGVRSSSPKVELNAIDSPPPSTSSAPSYNSNTDLSPTPGDMSPPSAATSSQKKSTLSVASMFQKKKKQQKKEEGDATVVMDNVTNANVLIDDTAVVAPPVIEKKLSYKDILTSSTASSSSTTAAPSSSVLNNRPPSLTKSLSGKLSKKDGVGIADQEEQLHHQQIRKKEEEKDEEKADDLPCPVSNVRSESVNSGRSNSVATPTTANPPILSPNTSDHIQHTMNRILRASSLSELEENSLPLPPPIAPQRSTSATSVTSTGSVTAIADLPPSGKPPAQRSLSFSLLGRMKSLEGGGEKKKANSRPTSTGGDDAALLRSSTASASSTSASPLRQSRKIISGAGLASRLRKINFPSSPPTSENQGQRESEGIRKDEEYEDDSKLVDTMTYSKMKFSSLLQKSTSLNNTLSSRKGISKILSASTTVSDGKKSLGQRLVSDMEHHLSSSSHPRHRHLDEEEADNHMSYFSFLSRNEEADDKDTDEESEEEADAGIYLQRYYNKLKNTMKPSSVILSENEKNSYRQLIQQARIASSPPPPPSSTLLFPSTERRKGHHHISKEMTDFFSSLELSKQSSMVSKMLEINKEQQEEQLERNGTIPLPIHYIPDPFFGIHLFHSKQLTTQLEEFHKQQQGEEKHSAAAAAVRAESLHFSTSLALNTTASSSTVALPSQQQSLALSPTSLLMKDHSHHSSHHHLNPQLIYNLLQQSLSYSELQSVLAIKYSGYLMKQLFSSSNPTAGKRFKPRYWTIMLVPKQNPNVLHLVNPQPRQLQHSSTSSTKEYEYLLVEYRKCMESSWGNIPTEFKRYYPLKDLMSLIVSSDMKKEGKEFTLCFRLHPTQLPQEVDERRVFQHVTPILTSPVSQFEDSPLPSSSGVPLSRQFSTKRKDLKSFPRSMESIELEQREQEQQEEEKEKEEKDKIMENIEKEMNRIKGKDKETGDSLGMVADYETKKHQKAAGAAALAVKKTSRYTVLKLEDPTEQEQQDTDAGSVHREDEELEEEGVEGEPYYYYRPGTMLSGKKLASSSNGQPSEDILTALTSKKMKEKTWIKIVLQASSSDDRVSWVQILQSLSPENVYVNTMNYQ
jgi:hypothetical protein